MGAFKNLQINQGIVITTFLKDKIDIRSTCKMNENETFLMGIALAGVSVCLEQDGYKQDDLSSITILFTNDGSFEYMQEENDISFGQVLRLIIYSVDTWRNNYLSDEMILVIYFEELIHHFWKIHDEVIVKEKVTEVMNRTLPNRQYKILDLYNREFLNNELLKQGKQTRF